MTCVDDWDDMAGVVHAWLRSLRSRCAQEYSPLGTLPKVRTWNRVPYRRLNRLRVVTSRALGPQRTRGFHPDSV